MNKLSVIGFLFIMLTILFTVTGQLLLKMGMHDIGVSPSQLVALPQFILRTFTNLKVLAGLSCAVIAAVAWMIAVSRSDLSLAYPFMGLAIVLVLALSPMVIGETVPGMRWVGVAVVCVGLWLTAR